MKQLVSGVTYIEIQAPIDNLTIEAMLEKKYSNIIRWAIVGVADNKLKITLTYKV